MWYFTRKEICDSNERFVKDLRGFCWYLMRYSKRFSKAPSRSPYKLMGKVLESNVMDLLALCDFVKELERSMDEEEI